MLLLRMPKRHTVSRSGPLFVECTRRYAAPPVNDRKHIHVIIYLERTHRHLRTAPEQRLSCTPEQRLSSTPEQRLSSTPEQRLSSTPEQRLLHMLGVTFACLHVP